MSTATFNAFLATAVSTVAQYENMTIRHMVSDYNEGRITLRLPFQRKPQWKLHMKQEWIKALLRRVLPDPLSISRRDGVYRCINGGNRLRAIMGFVRNEFPITFEGDSYWYSEVPQLYRVGRAATRNHVLLPEHRSRLLDFSIHLNIRDGLTNAQESQWYGDMNKNAVPHTPGQTLVSNLCRDTTNPFGNALLRHFPQVKERIEADYELQDEESLGYYLADILGHDVDVMTEDDKAEDTTVALAIMLNLLATGTAYKEEWKGIFDPVTLDQNIRMVRDIFRGIEFTGPVKEEFAKPSSNKKKFLKNIWAPSYLLGGICYSVAKGKENVVQKWRHFLQNLRVGLIQETYQTHNRDCHKDDKTGSKYQYMWEQVEKFTA